MTPAAPSAHANQTFNRVLRGRVVNPATPAEPTPYIHICVTVEQGQVGSSHMEWTRPPIIKNV